MKENRGWHKAKGGPERQIYRWVFVEFTTFAISNWYQFFTRRLMVLSCQPPTQLSWSLARSTFVPGLKLKLDILNLCALRLWTKQEWHRPKILVVIIVGDLFFFCFLWSLDKAQDIFCSLSNRNLHFVCNFSFCICQGPPAWNSGVFTYKSWTIYLNSCLPHHTQLHWITSIFCQLPQESKSAERL